MPFDPLIGKETQFKKGISYNPGGRPKGAEEARKIARELSVTAILTIHEIMMNQENSPSVRLAAANSMLDRGIGKPAQALSIQSSLGDRPVEELTTAEIKRMLFESMGNNVYDNNLKEIEVTNEDVE